MTKKYNTDRVWQLAGQIFAMMIILTFFMSASAVASSESAYPERPVQIIVPYPAGGSMAAVARVLAEEAKPYFKQPITIVNKGGGGGTIGTAAVINSAPDGYNLGLLYNFSLVSTPHLEKGIPYKGPEDVQPVSGCVISTAALLVKP